MVSFGCFAELEGYKNFVVKVLEGNPKATQELARKIGSHKKGDPAIRVKETSQVYPVRVEEVAYQVAYQED
jgi:hypothetical protein